MLNEEKIRIMTGIAMFEKKAGRDILPASRYFKSDYVGGRMIRSFIFYTFSSMLCLALWVLYQMEDIMSTMDVTALLASAKHVPYSMPPAFWSIWLSLTGSIPDGTSVPAKA